MPMQKPKVIAIVGPTSSGKSTLGIYLAQKLGGEVISADSRQVYRGLNIGTGKVTKREMAGVPHHVLDVASTARIYTASDFVHDATVSVRDIVQKEKIPVIVGGTGFYVDTLLGRMSIPEVPPNPKLRVQLEKKTPRQLFLMLKKKDPRRAKTIDPKNKRRLVRALEIAHALGKSPEPITSTPYDTLWLGIKPSDAVLQKKIHERLLARLKQGMVAEAKQLHKRGLSYKRMDSLGLEYRFLARFLRGDITPEVFVVELERAIVQYAKRQFVWFKRNKDIHWVASKAEALRLAKTFLSR